MYNSIIQFAEKDTKKIEKLLNETLLEGDMLRFEYGLLERLLELGRNLYVEILEGIEKTIRTSEVRRQKYYVEHKSDKRELLTVFGTIDIKRAYYTLKSGNGGEYLLDRYVGIESNDRVSHAVLARALREAVETSYRKGGEEACLSSDVVSKQTVKKLIHGLDVEMPEEIPEEKKKIKALHIQADEDHVALQFFSKKGDLKEQESDRKNNTAMPKLILLYEDIMGTGKGSKRRHVLVGKHYFGGMYEGGGANEELWLEVQQYIYDHYDTGYLEDVYIAGDGAPWIVAGCKVLEKSKFVLDKFHLGKYIRSATAHLGEEALEARALIYEAINNKDLKEVKRLLKKCAASAETEYKRQEIGNCYGYIKNNWLGIMVRIDDGGAVWGCSAEGHISHVLSARESSRPMGWSKTGVDKMTRLRVFTRNGGDVIDLMDYQLKKKKREKKKTEEQDRLVREIKKTHKLSGQETLEAKIPGLEKAGMNWMREIIYGSGYTA